MNAEQQHRSLDLGHGSTPPGSPRADVTRHAVSGFWVYLLIFATGAAGLIYQVAWHRYLGRLLGSDTAATAIILGVFLGGLAIGYRLLGDLSARITNHFKAYAFLELGIGVWGLAFPVLFALLYSLTADWSLAPPFLLIFQGLVLTCLLIGPPTICMGGTIPILTRGLSRNLNDATRVHAKVYAINTLGAFVGTLAAGFWLIATLGLPGTVRLAALLNLAAGAFFFWYALKPRSLSAEPPSSMAPPASTRERSARETSSSSAAFSPRLLYLIAFCSGLSVMTLENVLIRITNLSLGPSAYSFAMIVGAFVLAIALGSLAVSRIRHLTRKALFLNQTAVVVLLIGLYATLDLWPQLAHISKVTAEPSIAGFWTHHARTMAFLTVLLMLPVGFMGAAIPIMFHELKRSFQEVGKHSGRLLAWNTAGNLAGSLVGGMLLFYVLDNGRVVLTAIAVSAFAAVLAARPLGLPIKAGAVGLFAAVLALAVDRPFYDHTRFMIGAFRERAVQPHTFAEPEEFYRRINLGQRLLFYNDGPSGTVSVIETDFRLPDGGRDRSIIVNGKSDSSTLFDIQTLRLSAHIPALLAPSHRKVFIIGLGTGVTAGELTLYPQLEALHVAEISSDVIGALRWFSQFTHSLPSDPRLRIHQGDAFRILARTPYRWDIIISEPSNPWVAGVDQLFTREFYELASDKLEDDGVLLQWMHLYEADERMLGMVLNTLSSVFPHSRVFLSQVDDLLILASKQPVTQHHVEEARRTLAAQPQIAASLAEIKIPSIEAVLLRELWNSSVELQTFEHDGRQTMDHPKLHYLAGKAFFLGKNVRDSVLFNAATADHSDSFLLTGTPGWPAFPALPEDFEQLRASVSGAAFRLTPLWPLVGALNLRAELGVGGEHQDKPGGQASRLDLIHLAGEQWDDDAWSRAGLGQKSEQERATILMDTVVKTRNWITPYPLDGLKGLLESSNEQGLEPIKYPLGDD